MFNFLCKSLILRNANRATRSSSPTHGLQFVLNSQYTLSVSPRLHFLSTDAKEEDSFAVSYLTNSCGFSRRAALSMSKHLDIETPDKPDAVFTLFENNGVTKTQVKHFIKRYPAVLLYDPEKTILPKIRFFQSKGITGADLGTTLTAYSGPFARSLENQIIPCFNYICNLLQSHEETVLAVKRYPIILCGNVETQMEPYVNILRGHGVSVNNILMFLRFLPGFRTIDVVKFKEDLVKIKEMGISPLKSQFIVALVAMISLDQTKWQSKFNLYKKWGFSEEQIVDCFVRFPWMMVASENKIDAAMDFFVNKMGWDARTISRRPALITLSLKKRVIPRAALFQYLTSKGVLKKEHSNFATYILYTEKYFLQRFVNHYDEAPELLKLYEKKLKSIS